MIVPSDTPMVSTLIVSFIKSPPFGNDFGIGNHINNIHIEKIFTLQ